MNEVNVYFNEEIKFLASAICEQGLPSKLMEAAQNNERKQMDEILNKFKSDNEELYERLFKLYNNYHKNGSLYIWDGEYKEEDEELDKETIEKIKEELVPYDPSEINPLGLLFIFILSREVGKRENTTLCMDECNTFFEYRDFSTALSDAGYEQIATYSNKHSRTIDTFDDLIKVFKESE